MTLANTRSSFVEISAEEAFERMGALRDLETVRTSSLHVTTGKNELGQEVTIIIGASDEAILINPAASQVS